MSGLAGPHRHVRRCGRGRAGGSRVRGGRPYRDSAEGRAGGAGSDGRGRLGEAGGAGAVGSDLGPCGRSTWQAMLSGHGVEEPFSALWPPLHGKDRRAFPKGGGRTRLTAESAAYELHARERKPQENQFGAQFITQNPCTADLG